MPLTEFADQHCPTPLPCLGEPSRVQLASWGVAVACAATLLAALAMRLGRSLDLLHWWLLVALFVGVAVADLASGLLHWAADSWGRADLPVIGSRILVPFRVHHVNPDDVLRRTFLDTNGDVATLSLVPLAAMFWIPLDDAAGQALALAGIGFGAIGVLTNQIHQWAHMPAPPRAVALLQIAGLLLGPQQHRLHHGRPYDGQYCITTGWCNRPLEAIGFFRWLERAITRLTGAVPRHDEQHVPPYWQRTRDDGARHV